jgi:hypothetical protein
VRTYVRGGDDPACRLDVLRRGGAARRPVSRKPASSAPGPLAASCKAKAHGVRTAMSVTARRLARARLSSSRASAYAEVGRVRGLRRHEPGGRGMSIDEAPSTSAGCGGSGSTEVAAGWGGARAGRVPITVGSRGRSSWRRWRAVAKPDGLLRTARRRAAFLHPLRSSALGVGEDSHQATSSKVGTGPGRPVRRGGARDAAWPRSGRHLRARPQPRSPAGAGSSAQRLDRFRSVRWAARARVRRDRPPRGAVDRVSADANRGTVGRVLRLRLTTSRGYPFAHAAYPTASTQAIRNRAGYWRARCR